MARILNLSGLKMDAARDEVHTEPDGGTYQVIVTWALLAAHPAHEAHDVLRPLVDLLEPMGELHIIEPSAEFAAREILADASGCRYGRTCSAATSARTAARPPCRCCART